MDRSDLPTTSLSQTRLHGSIDKPPDNNVLRPLALPQPVTLNPFALRPPLFTKAQLAYPACDAQHSSPPTMSSPKPPPAAGSPVNSIAPIPQHASLTASPSPSSLSASDAALQECSPGQRHHDDVLTPDPYEGDEDNAELRSSGGQHLDFPITARQSDTPPPDFPSRYAQAFSIMTSMFGSILTPAKIIIVIRTGDKLIRDDATTFLIDQLPLWKGIWCQSNLPMPSSDDSVTDRFVKVSQYISILEERSIMDRVRILFHRVLQYQYYLRALEEVKQKSKDSSIKRKRGVRDATYALDHLLKHLYIQDWDQMGPAEKQTRRNLFHRQKHVGKRLLRLSSCMGFGILLLGSPEAMGRMKVTPFQNKAYKLTG
jgi:hypothetical protein